MNKDHKLMSVMIPAILILCIGFYGIPGALGSQSDLNSLTSVAYNGTSNDDATGNDNNQTSDQSDSETSDQTTSSQVTSSRTTTSGNTNTGTPSTPVETPEQPPVETPVDNPEDPLNPGQ